MIPRGLEIKARSPSDPWYESGHTYSDAAPVGEDRSQFSGGDNECRLARFTSSVADTDFMDYG